MRTVRLLSLLLALGLFFPALIRADVQGIAYGYPMQVTLNFDGEGGCRMLLFYDRENLIDFAAGDLAESCAKVDTGLVWTTVYVEDALPLYVSLAGHFTAVSLATQP